MRVQLRRVASVGNKKSAFDNDLRPYVGLEHIHSWTGEITASDDANPEGLVAHFEEGNILFGKLRPYLAKVAAPEFKGVCSTEALVIKPAKRVETRFLRYSLSAPSFINRVNAATYGAKMPRANWETIGTESVYVPDLKTQRRIADFLDRETAKIDLLIEKKKQLVALLAPRFEVLIHNAHENGVNRRFGFCARAAARQIPRDTQASYLPLGLFNRGRGFFRKPKTAYSDLGESSFYFVKERDLVFSGQFAWEGAVGLVSRDENDCVVSHRYPVYTGTEGVASEYLFAYFRSHRGQFLMENCSRGAAGRNRPLNTRILEKEKIPVPSTNLQEQIVKVVEHERRLKKLIAPSIARLKEYRSALITAAVTGQIDVKTYAKSGTSDRRLDVIQEEMGA